MASSPAAAPHPAFCLVGFAGKKESGKDTAAQYVAHAVRHAFADPLKLATMAMFDFTREQVYDEELKKVVDPRYGETPRQKLQWLGTDVVRDQLDKDHWYKLMERKICAAEGYWMNGRFGQRTNFLITDCRFDNEAELIRKYGGCVIEVWRTPASAGTKAAEDTHASEAGISPHLIHAKLENNGTKDELWAKVRWVVDTHYA